MPVRMTETAIQAAAKRAAMAASGLTDPGNCPACACASRHPGGRSWVLACRDTLGRMRRFSFGESPAMGVAEARGAARGMRAEVRKGADPVAEARRKRKIGQEAREGVGTLTAVLDLCAKQRGDSLEELAGVPPPDRHVFAAIYRSRSRFQCGDASDRGRMLTRHGNQQPRQFVISGRC